MPTKSGEARDKKLKILKKDVLVVHLLRATFKQNVPINIRNPLICHVVETQIPPPT